MRVQRIASPQKDATLISHGHSAEGAKRRKVKKSTENPVHDLWMDAGVYYVVDIATPCRNCFLGSDISPQSEKVFDLAPNALTIWIQPYDIGLSPLHTEMRQFSLNEVPWSLTWSSNQNRRDILQKKTKILLRSRSRSQRKGQNIIGARGRSPKIVPDYAYLLADYVTTSQSGESQMEKVKCKKSNDKKWKWVKVKCWKVKTLKSRNAKKSKRQRVQMPKGQMQEVKLSISQKRKKS